MRQSMRIGASLAAVLLGSLLAACAPTLSDGARLWCADVAHYPALKRAAEALGIDETTLIYVEWDREGTIRASDAQKADYARACTAAFESR